jgi:hypothetical protein
MRYKLDLVGTKKDRWGKGGTVRPEDYIFSMEKGLTYLLTYLLHGAESFFRR